MFKRNTPLKRVPFKRKATWKKLRPVSKAKHRLEKRFVPPATLLELDIRCQGRCECHIWVVDNFPMLKDGEFHLVHSDKSVRCSHHAEKQPHHLKPRARGGKHDISNLLKCCFWCHRWIHDNDTEATKRGLLRT